jgi:hypothetical protein
LISVLSFGTAVDAKDLISWQGREAVPEAALFGTSDPIRSIAASNGFSEGRKPGARLGVIGGERERRSGHQVNCYIHTAYICVSNTVDVKLITIAAYDVWSS